MEILVTIVAFWLILVGVYGAFSLTQERNRERPPRVRTPRPANLATPAPAGGPFGPVSLPAETVPSFITRGAPPMRVDPLPPAYVAEPVSTAAPEHDDAPGRFRVEKVIAERVEKTRATRVQQAEAPRAVRHEEPSYDEPRYQQTPFQAPARHQDAEVDFLRAQVEHLRSEIYALSSDQIRRTERPKQRRYRTGNYTHLPRTLRRQVNELRGFRRFFRI